MPSMSFRSITGNRGAGQWRVAGDGDDVGVGRGQQRLAVGNAMNFELRKRIALETLDQHEIVVNRLHDQVGLVPTKTTRFPAGFGALPGGSGRGARPALCGEPQPG